MTQFIARSGGLFRRALATGILAVLSLSMPHGIRSQSLQPGFADALVMGGWNTPVGVVWDANGRAYVWEKRGMVWIVQNGVRLPNPLIDISDEVGHWRDHGLLGFALDPQFLENGRIYLMYLVDRHHLLHHGTASYDPATNAYFEASIMRITRYTAAGPSYTSVLPASRFVLLGETPSTGVPNLHESHSTGSLVFGTDGTLLASVGDGASYSSVDVGNAPETYFAQALADGIIRPEENVGAFRPQMVNSLNGKVLRLDPNTGNGVPSNPWFDPTAPRAPRSRVWALGLRNPFRMTIKPGSGSADPAAANPGTLFIGDVGWNGWEDLHVCTEPGQNFGWPLFEGMDAHAGYMAANTPNRDAPNPLFGTGGCTQQFFLFKDLLKQETPFHLNAHPNPCNSSVQIPNAIPKHFHSRPVVDWFHGNRSRVGAFSGGTAITHDLDHPSSPVPGPRFGGYCAIGGPWMAGQNMPPGYQNSTFHGDYAGGWIRRFMFDANDKPVSVHDFASGLGAIVWIGAGPDGCVWYIRYNTNEVRRICYTLAVDLPPVAVALQDVQYGPGPLTVQFTGSGSSDPDGGALTYHWNFGDGATSTDADPQHTFTAPPGVPTSFTVTLTVTDAANQSTTALLLVSVNNTPPQVAITSFADGGYYPVGIDTTFTLEAAVSDAEHGPAQLSYAWRTTLHHNTHTHPEPIDPNPVSSTPISGVGCDGELYYYVVSLTVTDAGGLGTTVQHTLHPACHRIAPTAVILADVAYGPGPLAVQFDGTFSHDPGTIVAYHWEFGDGTTSSVPAPAKVFTEMGPHQVTLTVTDDDGLTGQSVRTITVLDPAPPQCVGATGSITREYYGGISGSTVADLVNAPIFPHSPTSVNYPTSFQGPINTANNYGTRMRGYIIAPTTGNYLFTAVSDDHSVVYLSPNADPAFKQVICSVPGWTNINEFNKYPSQNSAPIHLEAGRYYYVEMLHKEGSGGDHLALFWRTPTNSTRAVVPGSALARWMDCAPGVRVRVALQGPYNEGTGLMHDGLRTASLIPQTEPYTALGLTQGGGSATVTPARLAQTGKNAVVDWVLVELRSKNNPAQVVATRAALLERDGDIVGTDGYARLNFALPADQYFVAVRHRNHLGAMTLQPVALGTGDAVVDFTLPGTATHGVAAQKNTANGKRALWAGDVHFNGQVKYTGAGNDRDPILAQIGGMVPTATFNGYVQADVDLDGVVRYTGAGNDRDVILQNIGGTVPTQVVWGQLP
jgi:PKD repeat protein/glucose/arabinose dehydrogenase